jgi:hypothetical protein
MSTLAVFLAVGGGGFAIAAAVKKNSVGSPQVKKDALTNKDLKNGKAVGTEEVIDESLGAGDLAPGSVGSAEVADASLQAADLVADEPFHVVGAAGQPSFGNGGDGDCLWSDLGAPQGLSPVSFYKDRNGVVHLSGTPMGVDGAGGDGACDSTTNAEALEDYRVFTLPSGYRPPKGIQVSTSDGSNTVVLLIGAETDSIIAGSLGLPAGVVVVGSGASSYPNGVYFDSVTFRAAAGSGVATATNAPSGAGGGSGLPGVRP